MTGTSEEPAPLVVAGGNSSVAAAQADLVPGPFVMSGMLCMALAVLLFSAMAVCIKLLGQGMPAHEKIFVRTAVTVPVILWMLHRQGISPWGNNRRLLLARGALGLTGMLAYFASLAALPLGNATLLTGSSPIFATYFASRFLGERAGRAAWFTSVACLVGVALVARPEPHAPLLASAIALGSAVVNGATYTVVRATARTEHHLVVVLALVLVSLPVTGALCAVALVAPDPSAWWVWPDAGDWWLMAGMTAASIAAQILMTMGMQRETASRATNMFFLGVVLALLWGQFLGDPPLHVLDLAGAALIVGSILALTWARGRSAARLARLVARQAAAPATEPAGSGGLSPRLRSRRPPRRAAGDTRPRRWRR